MRRKKSFFNFNQNILTSFLIPSRFPFAGEITSDSSPQTASSPSLQISPTASANGNLSNSENHKNARAKRKPIHNTLQYSVDKMLNERNKLIVENNKKFLQSSNNNNNNNSYNGNLVINNNHHSASNFFNADKIKYSDSNMNVIKNGQLSPSTAQKLSQITLSKCLSNGTNNGNKTNGTGSTVKTERLSPPMNDLSMYRWVDRVVQLHNWFRFREISPVSDAWIAQLFSFPSTLLHPMNSIRFLTVPSFKSFVLAARRSPEHYQAIAPASSVLFSLPINAHKASNQFQLPRLIVGEKKKIFWFLMESASRSRLLLALRLMDFSHSISPSFLIRGQIAAEALKRFVDVFLLLNCCARLHSR